MIMNWHELKQMLPFNLLWNESMFGCFANGKVICYGQHYAYQITFKSTFYVNLEDTCLVYLQEKKYIYTTIAFRLWYNAYRNIYLWYT